MSIADNITALQRRMDKAAREAGRDPASVHLVAVSKKQPPERIRSALEAGQRLFGENRVQEASAHWEDIKASGAYPDMNLHLIGPLQTNKVKEAVALFDCIETVDREKLVHMLAREMEKQNRRIPCLIQVNTGEESQKSGVAPQNLPDLLTVCRGEGLNIQGLMCIPPADDATGVHFAFLHKLAAEHGLQTLSMGMSGDFETAIRAGATHIRVGTAVFGKRPDIA